MCRKRYAADIPFLLPKTQLPPTRSDVSKHWTSMPRSCERLDGGDAGRSRADDGCVRQFLVFNDAPWANGTT